MGAAESTVGVRELRQNLSVYLRRVAAGEVFAVTEHGRPVAVLGPLPPSDAFERLVAAGVAHPAQGDLFALGPPLAPEDFPGDVSLSDALQEQRADRL
jgi:prevent-host-death family protein